LIRLTGGPGRDGPGANGETAERYAELARDYDQNWAHSDEFLAGLTGEIVDALGLTTTSRLADVGCGTGLFTRRITTGARLTTPVARVDPSAVTRRRPPRNGEPRLDGRRG
jgi:hypothetical protein